MSTFRAFRGKNANKFYMFRNEKRRKSFHTLDVVLRIIYWLSFAAFIVSIALFAIGLMIWLVCLIFTLGLVDDVLPGYKLMTGAAVAMLVTLVIYAAVYLIKFVLEWIFILSESAELKKKPEENRDYLAVAGAVKRVKVFGLIMMAAFLTAVGVIAAILTGEDGTFDAASTVCLVVAIAALIANKIYSTKQFLKVQPQIAAIDFVRYVEKQERRFNQVNR